MPTPNNGIAAAFLLAIFTLAFVGSGPRAAFAAPTVSQSATEKARQLATAAKGRAKAKRFDLAAEMFHEAFKINPGAWAFLFSAARCEQLDGQFAAAKRDYTKYLSFSTGDHKLRERAQGFLREVNEELVRKRAAEQVEREEADKRAAKADAQAKKQRKEETALAIQAKDPGPVAWGLLAAGGVGAGVGAFLLVSAIGDQSDLDADLTVTGTGGKVSGITFDEAKERQSSIDLSRTVGVIALGTGAALAGIGGYLVATSNLAPEKSVRWQLIPRSDGAFATLHWRF